MYHQMSNGTYSQVPSMYPSMMPSVVIGASVDPLGYAGTPNAPSVMVPHQWSNRYQPVMYRKEEEKPKSVSASVWREKIYPMVGLNATKAEKFYKCIDMDGLGTPVSKRSFSITKHFEIPFGVDEKSKDIELLSHDDIKVLTIAHIVSDDLPYDENLQEYLNIVNSINNSYITTRSLNFDCFRNTGPRSLGVSLLPHDYTEKPGAEFLMSSEFKHKILTEDGPSMFVMPGLMENLFMCPESPKYQFESSQPEELEYFTQEYIDSVFTKQEDGKYLVRHKCLADDKILGDPNRYGLGTSFGKETHIDKSAYERISAKLKEDFALPSYKKNRGITLRIKNASNRSMGSQLSELSSLVDSVVDLTVTIQGKLLPVPHID